MVDLLGASTTKTNQKHKRSWATRKKGLLKIINQLKATVARQSAQHAVIQEQLRGEITVLRATVHRLRKQRDQQLVRAEKYKSQLGTRHQAGLEVNSSQRSPSPQAEF